MLEHQFKDLGLPFYPDSERLFVDYFVVTMLWFGLAYLISNWPDLSKYKMDYKT